MTTCDFCGEECGLWRHRVEIGGSTFNKCYECSDEPNELAKVQTEQATIASLE